MSNQKTIETRVEPKPKLKRRSCANCRYWDSVEGATVGICHRYPPAVGRIVPNTSGTKTPECYFPLSGEATWCGEFVAKNPKGSNTVKSRSKA